MESRIHLLLLRTALLSALLAVAAGCSSLGRQVEPMEDANASSPVIDPRIERRKVAPPKIDSEDFELTGYWGMLSVEDFGTNSVVGARLAYHVTEGLFAEATYAQTSDVDRTSAEILGNYDLSFGSDRKYKYYDLSLGYNLLPGEVFIGRNRAFNSAFYVIAGAGNTSFHDEDMFTLSFGGGYRLLLTDAIGLHLDVRDHLFDDDISGEDKTTHNIEFSLGLSCFF
jgi:outer membrane beta-barrel protein